MEEPKRGHSGELAKFVVEMAEVGAERVGHDQGEFGTTRRRSV